MSPIEGASADPGAMNAYAYEFRACPGEGTTPGGWELHLMHNGKAVEVIPYPSGPEKVDEAVKRGQDWVAERERYGPPLP